MQPITTTTNLADACARMARHPFVTVDTEFLRESTYYPRLCVAQMASTDEAIVIDTRTLARAKSVCSGASSRTPA